MDYMIDPNTGKKLLKKGYQQLLATGKLTEEQQADLEQEKQLKLKTMMDNNAYEIGQKLIQIT